MPKESAKTIVVLNGTARTCQHIAAMALERGDTVRAVVRSASRFHAKLPKQDRLSAHEWTDYEDVAGLAPVLDGADAVFVAVGGAPSKELFEPSSLNEQVVIALSAALQSTLAPGARSPTKVVLLTAAAVVPEAQASAAGSMIEKMLGRQFDDLRRSQRLLRMQSGWLDWSVVSPGPIVDSEDSGDAKVREVELVASDAAGHINLHPPPISYARLAHGMLALAEGPAQNLPYGHCYLPVAKSKVRMAWSDMESVRTLFGLSFVHLFLPWLSKRLAFAALAGGAGYVLGVREQGAWPLRQLGVNLRSLW